MLYNINGGFMYFENVILNLLIILVIVAISALINWGLNSQARFLMKYTSSLKMNSKEICEKYSLDEKINIQGLPSNGGNDLDNYVALDNYVFINARHYYATSLYTLGRTLYFLSMSKVYLSDCKKFKFQHHIDLAFTLVEVLCWGLMFIGFLVKVNLLIIIPMIVLFISFVFVLINSKTIKLYHSLALEYLSKVSKEKKEVNVVRVIYRFEFLLYILRPLLSCVKLFPILLSSNQRKMKVR